MSRARVLWVTAEAPNREMGGGSIRQAYLLSALAERVGVDLMLAGSGPDPDDAVIRVVQNIYRHPSARPVRPSKLVSRVRSLAGAVTPLGPTDRQDGAADCRVLRGPLRHRGAAYDLVMIIHIALAPLLAELEGRVTCLEMQRIASRDARQQLALAQGRRQRWIWERTVTRSERFEAWATRNTSYVVTVSGEDAAALPAPSVVIPNGVDLARYALEVPRADPHGLVFTGTLNYGPNVDGLVWFCRKVFPLVRAAVPDATFAIVGRQPVPEVRLLAQLPGVLLWADVEDTRPYLQAARAVVVPLRFGSGTRLKVLEALASGRPVIGTSIGLEGLGIVDGQEAAVADTAPALAEKVVATLGQPASSRAMTAGRALATRYSWQSIATKYANQVTEWLSEPRIRD